MGALVHPIHRVDGDDIVPGILGSCTGIPWLEEGCFYVHPMAADSGASWA